MENMDQENLDFANSMFEMSLITVQSIAPDSESDPEQNHVKRFPKPSNLTKMTLHQKIGELKKKPLYTFGATRHASQKYYARAFTKYGLKKVSRIKKRSLIMQMMHDPDNRCSGVCFEEISVLYAKIADIKSELELYKNTFGELKSTPNISERLNTFVNCLKLLKLELEPASVRSAFYKNATSIEEVQKIKASSKSLSSQISSIYTERKQNMPELMKSNRRDIYRVFGCVQAMNNNKQYLMNLFGKPALRYIDNDMALYLNVLIDPKQYNVKMVHVDGRFYSSPTGWKQTFEIVGVLERDSGIKSASLGFALLRSSTQENYTLFFKKLKDFKYINLGNIMFDFEIAIYNAAKSVFPLCTPRGCYYHYRNNVVNMATKIERWLGAKISVFASNILSLAPYVEEPAKLIYSAIKRLSLGNNDLFKNCDFKLLMYVFETYVLKLKSFFKIDLQTNLIRTNNACEGRNSALKRKFSFRPPIYDLVDYMAIRFKKDAVKNFKTPNPNTAYDSLLVDIQLASKDTMLITEFCKTSPIVCVKNAEFLLSHFTAFKNHWSSNCN